MMKILHIINSLNTGGAEKLILDTLPLYNKKGIKADVLVFDGKKHPFYQKLEKQHCCTIFSLKTKSVYNPLLILKITPYLKKYDILHVHLFPAQYWVVLAKILTLSKVKLVFTEHCTSNRRLESKWFSVVDKFIYRGYERIICISNEIQDIIFKHTNLEKRLLPVIENGVDLNTILNADAIPKGSISESLNANDKLMIQVAGFREQKDQKSLIKAMKLLPNEYKLILIGDGITKPECIELVSNSELKGKVFFLGVRSDVPNLLKSADIVVLSTNFEGLSLSSIEGLASGKPFIGSDVPGLREVVQGAGILFENGNSQELANYILKLLSDDAYYKKIAAQGFDRAQKYDINKMVDKHIKLYKSLVYEV